MTSAPTKRTVIQIIDSGLAKHGSFEDFMIQLATSCTAAGVELHYIFPAIGSQEVRSMIEAEGATVWIVPGPWELPENARGISTTIEKIGAQVVDFHFGGAGSLVRVYLKCRLAGIKVLFHYHGEIRPLHTLNWRNRHLSQLRLVSFFVDRFIAVSRANATFLRVLNVKKPIDVIYNGIHVDDFRRHATPRDASPTVRLLSIGSLIHRKRVDILLRAFEIVKRTTSSVTLTIVGGGVEEANYKRLATELGLNDSVIFTGLLNAYPYDLLSNSDIFVSASESESFGLMFAEAMVLGLPVVACNVGGIPEVVLDGVTGVLVPPGDPIAFATAMQRLIDDPEARRRMGAAGLQHVQQNFDLAPRVEDLVGLLAAEIP
jgi:glycosyltransferase involved in cell wall biosynthesis